MQNNNKTAKNYIKNRFRDDKVTANMVGTVRSCPIFEACMGLRTEFGIKWDRMWYTSVVVLVSQVS